MMKRKHSPSCFWIILLSILFLDVAVLKAQSRAIRPVNLQIPNEGEVQLYQGSYALVIGVSDYQDNAWVDLGSVKADVDAVSDTLKEHGFFVQTLMNPTESVLLDSINEFIDAHGYEQGNRLLFYYAGHGHTQERNGRKFGYLVPADAPNPFENEKEFFRKSIKMEQIISWAKQIESKHALFVFDSCFSGSVLQSRAITVPEDISYLTAKPVRQFLSAGSANQTVPAISAFRPLFIRGINGQADLDKDGYVTGVELGMYLQKQVPRYQTGQTPQYGKILDVYLDEGNFVFEARSRRKSLPKTATLYLRENDWFNGSRFNPASWKTSRLLESDIVYVGEVSNGLPNGQGTFTWLDGAKYVGEFKDGKANGQGTFTFPDGGKYVGEWGNGGWNGHGTLTSSASEKYVGEFKDGKYHGQGTFTSADGQVLSGLWKDGKFVSENQSPSKTVTLYISKDKWENYLKSIPSNWTTNRILENDIVYVGEVSNGVPNGQGTVTRPDGTKHVGAWKDGKANGQGTLTWPSGHKYVGEFKDNKYHGQGTFTSPDGLKYVGELKDNKYHGQGTTTYSDGTKHVGAWKDGKANGQGTFTSPDGLKYVGEFKDNNFHGQGTFTSPDGLKYVGEWKGGKYDGQGTYTWTDGRKYVGEWKDDKFNGQGTFTFVDGRVRSGLWKDGEFLGETTVQQKEIISKTVTLYISLYTWKYDSKSIPANWETSRNLESDHVYVGEVSNELPNGQGTLTFSDGAKYVGEFRDGQFNGQGTHSFSDGAKYVGEFRDGQFNGQGTYTWPDGTKYIGYWLNGLKNGQGTQTFPDGQVKNGLWIFDKFSEAKPVQQEQQEKPVQTEQLKSGAMTLYISKDDWLSGMESNPASWKTQNNLESDLSFAGEVNNGVPNGWGSWESSDGYKYVGEWVAGKWHGQGTYTSPDGTKYVGEWANNEWHGQGTHTSSDGTKYVGEYKNGLEHGQGTWTRLNGDEYVGEWEDGERSGQGTYTYSDGTKYVGSFRNGRFHGQGTFTWPEGRWWLNETNEIEKKGFWRNGEFVGSP